LWLTACSFSVYHALRQAVLQALSTTYNSCVLKYAFCECHFMCVD
jgi:hypothetical protein